MDQAIDRLVDPVCMAHRDDAASATVRQVLCDMDSTLYPLLTAMANHPGGEKVCIEDCHSWEMLEELSGGKQQMLELFASAMSLKGMRATGLLPGAAAATRCLQRHQIGVHLLTDRPSERAAETEKFLKEQGVVFSEFRCSSGIDKLEYCRQNDISVIVDDHPALIREASAQGLKALSLAWPYNTEALQGAAGWSDDWLGLSRQILTVISTQLKTSDR